MLNDMQVQVARDKALECFGARAVLVLQEYLQTIPRLSLSQKESTKLAWDCAAEPRTTSKRPAGTFPIVLFAC